MRFIDLDLHFNDNEGLTFGTGDDSTLLHDGTNLLLDGSVLVIGNGGVGGNVLSLKDGNTTGGGMAVGMNFIDQVDSIYGFIGNTIITSTFLIAAPIGGLSMTAAQGMNISCGAANEIRFTTGSVVRHYETTEAEYLEIDPVSTTQFNVNLSNASSSLQFFGANFYRFNDGSVQCEDGLVVNDDFGGFITFEDGGIERGSLQFSDTLGLMVLTQTSGHIFRIQRGINSIVEFEETGGLTIYEDGAADTDFINLLHDGVNARITTNAGLFVWADAFNMQDNYIRNVGLDVYFIEDLDITVAANALTVSTSISNSFEADLEAATAAVTATLGDPGVPAGAYYQCVVKVEQDSTTPQTVTWAGGTMRWPDGVAHPMNTTAGGFSIFTFETWDDGTIWYGTGRDYS